MPGNLRQLPGDQAALQCGGDAGPLVQEVCERLLGLDPFGHVPQHHELAGRATAGVPQRLAPHLVRAGLCVATGQAKPEILPVER